MKLVKMKRELPPDATGAREADVHPDEVENFKRGEWVLAEPIAEAVSDTPKLEPVAAVRKPNKKAE